MISTKNQDFKSGYALLLILIGCLLGCIALAFIVPLWKMAVVRSYIVDPAQLVFASQSALRFGIIALILSLVLLSTGLLLHKHHRISFLTNFTVNLSLVIITLGLGIFVGENTLRVLLPRGDHIFTYHPKNIWDLKAGAEGKYRQTWVEVNAQGFRGRPLKLSKSDGFKRYVFLGNSVTFGYNMRTDWTFTHLLEHMLNFDTEEGTYQIANLAVPGYDVRQEYNKLKEFDDYEFDRLFVGFCFNDVTSRFDFDPKFGGQDVFESVPSHQAPWQVRVSLSLKNKYALCYWGNRILEMIMSRFRRQQGPGRQESAFQLLSSVVNGVDNEECRHAWTRTLNDLDTLKEYSDGRAIPLTIVIYPYRNMYPEVVLRKGSAYPAAPLIDWAEQNSIDHIDIIRAFQEEAVSQSKLPSDFFMDMNHPNAEGHKLIAETIYSYLQRIE